MKPILLENNTSAKKYYGTTSAKSMNRSPLDISNSCLISQDNYESDRSFTDEDHTPWEQSGRGHHQPAAGVAIKEIGASSKPKFKNKLYIRSVSKRNRDPKLNGYHFSQGYHSDSQYNGYSDKE